MLHETPDLLLPRRPLLYLLEPFLLLSISNSTGPLRSLSTRFPRFRILQRKTHQLRRFFMRKMATLFQSKEIGISG